MLHYLVEDGATPGIVFGIVEHDGETRALSAGTGGSGTGPLGPESVFELGSITKTFTGTLLALAVRRGEVSLDDPVADYLPDSVRVPSWDGREITLVDLATHRSGLPGLPSNYLPGDLANPYAAYTLEVLYDFLATHDLRREPGTETEYSNLGFGLLGHALARAAGMPYTELVRTRILDPLGMDDTGYALDGERAESMALPHSHGEVVPAWTGTEAIHGAGGLRSTMEDMLKYLAANVGPPDTDLERAIRDAQQARAQFDPGPTEGSRIGLAWRIIPAGPAGDGVIVEHAGGTAGSSARIAFDPDRGVGFVRLANTGDFPDDLGRFPDDLGVYMLQTGPPIDRPAVDVPREVLERRVGAYRYAPDADLYIRLEDEGWLSSQLGPTVRFRLYPDSDTTVYLKRIPTTLAFRTAASGEVEAVALGPRKQVLPKVSEETPDPHLPTAEILDRPLSPQEIARYEGTYVLEGGDGQTIELRVYGDEDRLAGQLVGGKRIRFRYQGDDTFVLERDPAVRVVFTVREGRASGVEVDLHGLVLTGRRDGGA
jgi:CubicO group peptidase (beta-lactamase class C family)